MTATATAVAEHAGVEQARERLNALRAREQRLQAAIRDALAGRELTVEELAELVYQGGEVPAHPPSVADVQAELEAVRLAIQRATTEVGAAKSEATEAVIAESRPRYVPEIRRLTGLVRELLAAAEEGEARIRAEAAEAGITPVLHPRHFHPLPDALRGWLELAEARYGA